MTSQPIDPKRPLPLPTTPRPRPPGIIPDPPRPGPGPVVAPVRPRIIVDPVPTMPLTGTMPPTGMKKGGSVKPKMVGGYKSGGLVTKNVSRKPCKTF